jgi:NhaP-type Na+/H+ or K+/H+ antiporter
MLPIIETLGFLLVVVTTVAAISARLRIPPAILLVLTGFVLALVPGYQVAQSPPAKLIKRRMTSTV